MAQAPMHGAIIGMPAALGKKAGGDFSAHSADTRTGLEPAHYYNQDSAKNNGAVQVVYNCKQESQGKWVRKIKRGVAEGISTEPWQTNTSIGDW